MRPGARRANCRAGEGPQFAQSAPRSSPGAWRAVRLGLVAASAGSSERARRRVRSEQCEPDEHRQIETGERQSSGVRDRGRTESSAPEDHVTHRCAAPAAVRAHDGPGERRPGDPQLRSAIIIIVSFFISNLPFSPKLIARSVSQFCRTAPRGCDSGCLPSLSTRSEATVNEPFRLVLPGPCTGAVRAPRPGQGLQFLVDRLLTASESKRLSPADRLLHLAARQAREDRARRRPAPNGRPRARRPRSPARLRAACARTSCGDRARPPARSSGASWRPRLAPRRSCPRARAPRRRAG